MLNMGSPIVQELVRTGGITTLNDTSDYNIFYNPNEGLRNPNLDYYNADPRTIMRDDPPTTEYRPVYYPIGYSAAAYYPQNTMPQYVYTQPMQQPQYIQQQPMWNNGYYPQTQQFNYGYQQQQNAPWNLTQPSKDYYAQYSYPNSNSGSKIDPFVQSSHQYGPGYGPNYYGNQQYTYVVPGFNPTGLTEMYTEDLRKKLEDLKQKYKDLNEEKLYQRRQQFGNSLYGYNYYGGFNNNYMDPILSSEYNKEKAALEAEAKQNVMDFNLRLSRAVHNYLGDKDLNNEEELEKIKQVYSNTIIEIPKPDMDNYYRCRALERGVDITEDAKRSAIAADRKVSEYFHKIVKPDADLDEFLDTAGLILWEAHMEEVERKGKDLRERMNYEKFHRQNIEYITKHEGPEYAAKYMERNLSEDQMFDMLKEMNYLDPGNGLHMDSSGTITLNREEWAANRKNRQVEANSEYEKYERQKKAFLDSIYNTGNSWDDVYAYNGGAV